MEVLLVIVGVVIDVFDDGKMKIYCFLNFKLIIGKIDIRVYINY